MAKESSPSDKPGTPASEFDFEAFESDRLHDQSMWTGQYEAQGKYPNSSPADESITHSPAKPAKRVYGSAQLQTADSDETAKEQHKRVNEEHELRESVTDEERTQSLEEIERAKRFLGYK